MFPTSTATPPIELQGPALGGLPEPLPLPPPPLSLHQLAPAPGDFTGRSKLLDELIEKVRFDSIGIVGVFGMGGIGKTAFAIKLAEELIPRFQDAQLYVDLQGTSAEPVSTVEAMSHIIRAFDPVSPVPEHPAEVEGKYRSVLRGNRSIIFLENAANREQVVPLIPPDGCLVVLTSRNRFALPGMLGVDLELPTGEEARQLSLRISPRLEHRADELAKLCGYLPQAIRQAASMLQEYRDLSVEDCLTRLALVHERRALVDSSIEPGYRQLSPELQRLWRLLAVFPGRFSPADAAAIWGMSQSTAQEFLMVLLSSSMLLWTESESGYRMHELVRYWALSRCSDEERGSIYQKLAEYAVTVLAQANGLCLEGGENLSRGLRLFDAERSNIEAGWIWASTHAEQDDIADQFCVRYPVAGRDVLEIRQTPAERIQWLQAPLAAARRMKDKYAEGILLGDVSTAYQHLGEIEKAMEYSMLSLTLSRETGDRKTEGDALRGLGLSYARKGELPHALEYHEKSFTVAREIRDRRAEGKCLGQLAGDYELMGNFLRAVELQEEARAIAIVTGDRCSEADHLRNLAGAFNRSGEYRQAVELGNQSLTIARSIMDRRREGAVQATLGHSFSAQGDARRSIECHEEHLKISREMGDRYGEGDALGNLGKAQARMGNARRALELYQDLLKVVRELGDRAAEATVLGNIGKAKSRLGETRVAIECHSEQLRIAREIGDRQTEANALWNTSLALEKLGDRVQAITHAEAARKIFEDSGDTESGRVKRQLSEWSRRSTKVN